MKHIYALGFATMFITGGISANYHVQPVKDQTRLPATEYVPWPEKNTARLEGYCNG